MTTASSRRLLGASSLGLCLLVAACSDAGTSGGVVATVDGSEITRAAFDKRIETTPAARQALMQLVQGKLLERYADQHRITASDAEIDKKLDELKTHYPNGQFDALVKQQGLTMTDVRAVIKQQVLLQKCVAGGITVTDKQISDYFEKNREQFNQPEQVHVRHILVEDLPTAELVEKQLRTGAKFETLAKRYSKDPSTRDRGGDLGFFGRKQMVPAFENAAFSQPLHVVGQPVKSQFGYHVIEVLERKPAVVATLADSKTKIKDLLTQQQEGEKVPAFLQDLQRKATISIKDPLLQNALTPAAPAGPG